MIYEDVFSYKLDISKKIFEWKEWFLETDKGKQIIKAKKSIEIFSGGLGHIGSISGTYGYWSRTEMTKDLIRYKSGYKWICAGPRFEFKDYQSLAKKLRCDYLNKILETIENKDVYNLRT